MIGRRAFIAGAAGTGVLAMSGAAKAETTRSHVRGVTAITQVFGDGQKLTAVAVEYDREIVSSTLSTSTFQVTDRTVTKVYANNAAGVARTGRNGRYVIVELSTDDAGAALWVTGQGSGGPPPGPGGPQVGDTTPGGTIVPATASLTQTGTVVTTDGTRYAATGTTLTTDAVVNPIVDDFRQFSFADPETGQTLNYNLFIPQPRRLGRPVDPRRVRRRRQDHGGSTSPGQLRYFPDGPAARLDRW